MSSTESDARPPGCRPTGRVSSAAHRLHATVREWGSTILGILYESWGDRARRFDRAHRVVWNFDTSWERKRYAQVLALAEAHSPPERWRNVLEVGCAKGVFTEQLARRCHNLTAIDISPLACAVARQRCSRFANVRVQQFDIVETAVAQPYDLVFALDLLEAIHGRRRLQSVIQRLEDAVAPGGLLVLSGSRLPPNMRRFGLGEWLLEGSDSQLRACATRPGLQLLACASFPERSGDAPDDYPEHLIAVLRKQGQ